LVDLSSSIFMTVVLMSGSESVHFFLLLSSGTVYFRMAY
jgi:hypothetical protein